jgi:hypothetical protein
MPRVKKPVEIQDITILGTNKYGYAFCVGRAEERWVGFAHGRTKDGQSMLFMLSEVSEDYQFGLPDRDRAIRLTVAVAQDPSKSYGGIDEWRIEPIPASDAEEFRCKVCAEIGCAGDCYNDFDREDL